MDNPYDPSRLNDEQLAERERSIERARHLAALSDTEVIAFQPGPSDDRHLMEMSRRLKDATGNLTRELVSFRESSDRLTGRVVWLTRVLVVLTVALVIIGGVQIYQAVNSGHATSAPTRPRSAQSR